MGKPIDYKVKIAIFVVITLLGFFALQVKADTVSNLPGEDLTIEGVFNIITGLACWLARTAGFVIVIFVILAGFKFMNARGNPKAFADAKTNFVHVLIGSIVILGVYVIIATVANAVGADFSFIPLAC